MRAVFHSKANELSSPENFRSARGLRADCANRATGEAIAAVAAHIHIVRIEVQAVRVVRIALVERTRPIVAVGTDIVD